MKPIPELFPTPPWAIAVAASFGPEYVSAEYLRLGHDLYQSLPTVGNYKRYSFPSRIVMLKTSFKKCLPRGALLEVTSGKLLRLP